MEYQFKNLEALAKNFEFAASQLRLSVKNNSKLTPREVSKRIIMAYVWESAAEIVQHAKLTEES